LKPKPKPKIFEIFLAVIKTPGDVHALLNTGILQKTEEGRIVFPFDAVQVNLMLEAA
jgi:hypothetical protein